MQTDVVMTLIAAVVVAMFLRSGGANRFHTTAAWVLGIYCGSISWIGPNVRSLATSCLGTVSHWLS